MRQAEYQPDEDERALLELLPADGSAADSNQIRSRLVWDAERYAHACVRLEEQGYVLAGHGRGETVCRDLMAVPPEFRPACGRPGSHVIVRQVPVTIPHALCDLTGVHLSYPGHGGAVTARPGHGTGNSKGFQVEVDARTLDVTIRVSGLERHPRPTGPDA
jgi:hypothetical protein